jgi:phenylpropionate dioxygenase-like ring-hydroxylating dioxygenase large terminal subunit
VRFSFRKLPESAKIPAAACVRSYEVRDVQGVVWAWMGRDKSKADAKQIPRFAQLDEPGNVDISSIHALPYDYSILLENLMDPAHIPISHDRTDPSARREDAQPLWFEITERTPRGFAGNWGRQRQRREQQQQNSASAPIAAFTRFQAPCVLSNESVYTAKDGGRKRGLGIFLCCPAGQGKSMLILRFCVISEPPSKSPAIPFFPRWLIHQVFFFLFFRSI